VLIKKEYFGKQDDWKGSSSVEEKYAGFFYGILVFVLVALVLVFICEIGGHYEYLEVIT